jgi:hypothetical protein
MIYFRDFFNNNNAPIASAPDNSQFAVLAGCAIGVIVFNTVTFGTPAEVPAVLDAFIDPILCMRLILVTLMMFFQFN